MCGRRGPGGPGSGREQGGRGWQRMAQQRRLPPLESSHAGPRPQGSMQAAVVLTNRRVRGGQQGSRGAAAGVVHGLLAIHKPLEGGVALDFVLASHLLLLGGVQLRGGAGRRHVKVQGRRKSGAHVPQLGRTLCGSHPRSSKPAGLHRRRHRLRANATGGRHPSRAAPPWR